MTENIGTIKNPLTIIAIFAGIAEVSGTLVLPFISDQNQLTFIYFLIIFPSILIILFFLTLNFNNKALYAPSDFVDETNYVRIFKYDESIQEKVEVSVSQDEMLTILNNNLSDFKKEYDIKIHQLEADLEERKKAKQNLAKPKSTTESNKTINYDLVKINHFDDAYKLANILTQKGYFTSLYGEPASHNNKKSHSAIWLGNKVSFEAAKEIIISAKNFYPHLEYIKLSEENGLTPERVHHQIFIGGATKAAINRNIRLLNNSDWKKIENAKSMNELHKIILR